MHPVFHGMSKLLSARAPWLQTHLKTLSIVLILAAIHVPAAHHFLSLHNLVWPAIPVPSNYWVPLDLTIHLWCD